MALSPKADRVLSANTAVAGVLTIALALATMATFPRNADLPRGFHTPIIAFELAQTESDLAFLTGPDEPAASLRTAMDQGHRWDTLFPFAYGGMLFVLLLHHALRGTRIAWLGLATSSATVLGDLWENLVLVEITSALSRGQSPESLLPTLHTATWSKWGLLAASLALLAACELRRRQRLAGVLSTLAATSIVLTWITGTWLVTHQAIAAELMGPTAALVYLFATFRAVRAVLGKGVS